MKQLFRMLPVIVILTACTFLIGEEALRIPINAVSAAGKIVQREGELKLEAGDEIAFWADMDMEYQEAPQLIFRIEIQKEKIPMDLQQFDPTQVNVKINEVRTELGGEVKWSYEGKLGEMTLKEAGNYTFRVMIMGNTSPNFVLNKAELIVRK